MMPPATQPTSPPWERLHARLLACAEDQIAAGDPAGGAALRATVEAWWLEQQQWNEGLARLLGVHHEISNALVGVSGNAQLLLLGPAGGQPQVRERLEVVVREAQRIRDAALALSELRRLIAPATAPGRSAPRPAEGA